MRRTQIYLDEEIYEYLKEESKRTGKTISEFIREKLKKEMYHNTDKLLESIKEIAGIWSYQKSDVNEFIRKMRKGKRIDNI